MKNNNKLAVILGIVLLNVLVIFMVGQSLLGKASQYDKVLEEARAYAKQELCSKAIEKYNEAIRMEDTLEIRLEMLDVYEKGIDTNEMKKSYSIFTSVSEMVEAYREEGAAYQKACEFMIKYEKYEDCAELLMQARDLEVTFDKLEEYKKIVRYKFTKKYSMYTHADPTYDGMIAVQTDDGLFTYLNDEGTSEIEGNYTYGSGFSEGYAFVKFLNNDATQRGIIIDKEGERQAYIDEVETSSGVGKAKDENDDDIYLLSCKIGERYKYYNINGIEAFGDYAFAGRFRNNVAAVKNNDGTWSLINGTGKAITETKFADVILNEFDECAPKGLIIAKAGGKYHIYDVEGNQVGKFACDDAKAFVDDYAAFKSDDLWGFVDSKGEIFIYPQYEDAKSFSNKMAAVQMGGVWSLISPDGEVVIDEVFEDVSYLNDKGVCFVKSEGYWMHLQMYYTGE